MTNLKKKSNNDSKTEKEYSTKASLPTQTEFKNIKRLIQNEKWAAEPKHDGQRLITLIQNDTISGHNRNGALRNTPNHFQQTFIGFKNTWIFDGELTKDTYHIFDILHAGENPTTENSYIQRHQLLETLFQTWNPEPLIQLVQPQYTPTQKAGLATFLLQTHQEGIVFKNVDSSYTAGRTGDWQKIKFTNTVDAIILEPNYQGKQAALIGLKKGEIIIPIGKISTHLRPPVDTGDVIEVRYLTVTPHGKLTQPIMLRKRDDKTFDQCTLDQLYPSKI
jgi:ATP-dependent DNA ligase